MESEEIDDYYQDFTREIAYASTEGAYIWVVSFNRWLPGLELPRKAILKGLMNVTDYEFKKEIKMLKEASQNNRAIVKYYHDIRNSINRWIFMEFCEKGSLTNYIEKQKEKGIHFSYSFIAWQFYWLAEALAWLHNLKIYHRDIKPDNIFVSDVEIFKLGDFGASRNESLSTRSSNTVIGTEFYMSPNLISKFGVGITETKSIDPAKDDVWAFGKTIFETMILQTGIDFRWKKESDIMASINENFEIIENIGYQPQLKNLIRSMMIFDENKRPSMQNVAYELYVIIQSLKIDSFQTLAHDATTIILPTAPINIEPKLGSRESTIERRSQNYSFLSVSEISYADISQNFDSYTPIQEESKSEIKEKCVYCNNFIDEDYFELECKHKYHKECMKKYVEFRVSAENNPQNLLCVICPGVIDLKRIIHGDLGLSQDCVLQIFKLVWRRKCSVCPDCKEKSKNSILSKHLMPHFIRCNYCQSCFCSFCQESLHKKCYKFEACLETYLSIFEGRNNLFDWNDVT